MIVRHAMKPKLIAPALALVLLVGCASTADFLESDSFMVAIKAGSTAGGQAIAASLGRNATPEQQQIIATAATGAITAGTTDLVYWIAEAMRKKQSTNPNATTPAKAGVITAAITAPGVDPNSAITIATSTAKLAATGVPANVANEVIATTVGAVAANK